MSLYDFIKKPTTGTHTSSTYSTSSTGSTSTTYTVDVSSLYEHYEKLVNVLIEKYSGLGSSNINELRSDGCFALYNAIRTYKKQRGRKAPLNYLYTSIRNALLLRLKKIRNMHEQLSEEHMGRINVDPTRTKPASDMCKIILEELKTLEPLERAVITLLFRLADDKKVTLSDIAEALNISTTMVFKIKTNAFRKLAKSDKLREMLECMS